MLSQLQWGAGDQHSSLHSWGCLLPPCFGEQCSLWGALCCSTSMICLARCVNLKLTCVQGGHSLVLWAPESGQTLNPAQGEENLPENGQAFISLLRLPISDRKMTMNI